MTATPVGSLWRPSAARVITANAATAIGAAHSGIALALRPCPGGSPTTA